MATKPKDIPTPGVCYACGCTDDNACTSEGQPCSWVGPEHTLCSACKRIKDRVEKLLTKWSM